MKQQRLVIKLFFSVITSLALIGCEQGDETTDKQHKTEFEVTDFDGNRVSLSKPASKIVALAPHIVENVFTAGAGESLIGVVTYSNFPERAKNLPLVGGYSNTNLEKIVELNPDLIIAWESGNAAASLEQIKQLGFNVYIDQPDNLEDVAKSIRDIGVLAGRSEIAEAAAADYLSKVRQIKQLNQAKAKVSTFYQVWNDPLQTINGKHIISDAIALCSGQNIYAEEPVIAPVINIESILQRDPLAIIASGMSSARPEWLDDWKSWPSLTAVKNDNLFFVEPDHIQRHTVRILLGIESICSHLDMARQRANSK